ncbi:EAL and HDOD domain-containing protein [Anaerocolumna xylanovorans]|uniref:EAL and modified HD-GYP domain-containing signal transduction protein n=1 Tax=Anaerocolumna xylanovorans DSM 12503 TaxID=1121345 RepID=A0A1M7YFZ6_9FIRM|nr:HDOD domain-containing protein [Anaerocolumna xylanovorans]SHO51577.1 EAL and modified HD-GYP domain-containing signal transduction protein [Anaerocolumna xylanovorans DSM 12503]
MDVYIARQPIFNRKMKVYGYELLYRQSNNNYFEGADDDQATTTLINDSFSVFGFQELIEQTRGFINFSQNLILGELAYMLPKDQVVIEILERVEPNEKVIEACKKLKEKGYILALDDFVLEQYTKDYLPLIEMADIIKVEFPAIKGDGIQKIIDKFGRRITFLAEKVETREEHQRAMNMGFKLFQGYYFSKPVMENLKDIGALNVNLVRIMNVLNIEPIDYDKIAEIIQQDVGLSYKFLKMSNSVYYGARYQIKSIKQGLLFMGFDEIKRWIYLMMLRGVQCIDNAELVKNSIVRGKMLSLLAKELQIKDESDYFIGGMFSSIDVLMNTSMDKALIGLPLSMDVREALLGKKNQFRWYLDTVLALEQANWEQLLLDSIYPGVPAERYMALYFEAIKWQRTLKDK